MSDQVLHSEGEDGEYRVGQCVTGQTRYYIVKEKMVSTEWDSVLQVRPGTT